MSSVTSFIGKLLFVSLFLLSGVEKVRNPKEFSKPLVAKYKPFSDWTKAHLPFQIPYFPTPDYVEKHADFINQVTGGVLIFASIGTLIGVPCTSLLLTVFIILCNVMIHNPLLTTSRAEYFMQLEQFIYNVGLLGISLMLCCQCCGKTCQGGKAAESSPQKKAEPASNKAHHGKKADSEKHHDSKNKDSGKNQGKNKKQKRD